MDKLPLIPIPIPITHKAITSRKRSLAMTITWRIVAEIDTLLVSYLITGSLMWSLSIVGIESTTKTFLYYCHERAWGHICGASSSRPRHHRKMPVSVRRDRLTVPNTFGIRIEFRRRWRTLATGGLSRHANGAPISTRIDRATWWLGG